MKIEQKFLMGLVDERILVKCSFEKVYFFALLEDLVLQLSRLYK